MDPGRLLVAGGVAVPTLSVVLWMLARRSRRVDRSAYRRGRKLVLLGALGLWLLISLVGALWLDQGVWGGFAGPIGLGLDDATAYAILAGSLLAVAYVVVSMGVLSAGLLVGFGRRWAAIAWVVVPVLFPALVWSWNEVLLG